MSVERKTFSGRFEPQKGALKKDASLPIYVTSVHAKNKSTAQTLLYAEFLKFAPDIADDYFKPKVWEACDGVPGTVPDAGFYTDFFENGVVWNAEKGEPERIVDVQNEEFTEDNPASSTSPLKQVKILDQQSRAACLSLFGTVTEITSTQYGRIIDLVGSDESSFERELAEAIARGPRVLQLYPERQQELLDHVKETAKESAQWTDIKKIIDAFLDTPPAQRITEKTPSGATMGGTEKADRIDVNTVNNLEFEIALGINARNVDFDIYNVPLGVELRANSMLEERENKNPDFIAWCEKLRSTPGILDYSRAAIIAMIKTSSDSLWMNPGEHRNYISRTLIETDHANPEPLLIEIACGRSSSPVPQKISDEKNEEELRHKTDLMLAQQRGECITELGDDPSDEKWEKTRTLLGERQIEIAFAINDLISGNTNVMGKEEAEGVVTCTGHLISHVFPLLMNDIETTEFCLSPDFSDEEIHDVVTTILDSWSDNDSERQKIALDAIVEYRRPEPPKPVVLDPPSITVKPVSEKQQNPSPACDTASLSYKQQLIIAALNGLCANPAYRGDYSDIPMMAVDFATEIVKAELSQ